MKRLPILFLILVFAFLLALPTLFPLAAANTSAPANATPVRNTIVLQVSQSEDDTSVPLDTNDNRDDWVYIRVGTSLPRYVNGLRFQRVTIPPGSRIVQARLLLFKSEWHTGFPIQLEVRAEASASALSFADSNPLANERPLTAASAEWSIHSPPTNYEWFESPDLTSLVQEVINRQDWQSENALAIIIKSVEDTPERHYLDVQSFDFSPLHAPKLEIVYETDVPVPTSTPTITPSPTITPTPEPGRLAIEQAKDLQCGVRLSGDTRNWDNNVTTYTACRPAWPETGPEAVYRMEIPFDHTEVQVQIFPTDSAQDLDIFLMTGAYPEDCLRGENATLSQSDLDAGVYYVAVDGYNGAAGAYTLTSHCTTHFENSLYLPMMLF